MEDKTQKNEGVKKNTPFHLQRRCFHLGLPDELVSQVVNEVKYLIPVMLHAARPEEHRRRVFNERKVSR